MENPYESSRPNFAKPSAEASLHAPTASEFGAGKVGQVRTVALLMLGQGILECLYGVFCAAFAVFSGLMFSDPEFARAMGPNPQGQAIITTVMYGGLSALAFTAGVLHIVAGARNYRFRGRTLGFVALAGGLLSAFTACCCPTTLAIGIWGMIVYLDPSVTLAFEMASRGSSREEILEHFLPPKTP